MKCPAYPRYKPSGVEWLGDVPEHWQSEKLKYVSHITSSGIWGEDNSEETDGVRVATTANIDILGNISIKNMTFRSLTAEDKREGLCNVGDIIVVKSSGSATNVITGKAGLVLAGHGDICFSNFTLRVRPVLNILHPRFAWYFLNSEIVRTQIRLMVSTTTYPNLDVDEYASLQLPMPEYHEQSSIVFFLDQRIIKIDTLIAQKRRLVETLKEKRIAIISRAVVHGLPPEAARAAGFNPNPRQKPSGAALIGNIPDHWRVGQFRHVISRIEQGWSPIAGNSPADDGQWGVLKLSSVHDGSFYPEENKFLDDIPENTPVINPQINDILISRANTPELVGNVCLITRNYPRLIIPDLIYKVKLKTDLISPVFICYYLLSRNSRAQIESDARGSNESMVKLSQGHILAWKIPIPPISEQIAISEYLFNAIKELNLLIAKTEAVIRCLQEYRTALITAAVTGKIDVRGVTA